MVTTGLANVNCNPLDNIVEVYIRKYLVRKRMLILIDAVNMSARFLLMLHIMKRVSSFIWLCRIGTKNKYIPGQWYGAVCFFRLNLHAFKCCIMEPMWKCREVVQT